MSKGVTGRPCVIAVDGPAGAGKSTVARAVAAELGYIYIDTGAMYRAVTLLAIRHNIPFGNATELLNILKDVQLRLTPQKAGQPNRIYINDEDVTEAIRQPQVNQHVSEVSQHAQIREHMVKMQRALARHGGIVMDGRDIGTVVLPNADVKVFLVADIEVRAERRLNELRAKGYDMTFEQVRNDMMQRDAHDRTRKESPLRKADGAIEIDTSNKEIPAVVSEILQLCQKNIE